MAIVNLQNVTYKYPLTDVNVLEDINLQVEEGEFVAVIGPNGAGKSTLCYTLAGFVPHFYKGELTGTVEKRTIGVGKGDVVKGDVFHAVRGRRA